MGDIGIQSCPAVRIVSNLVEFLPGSTMIAIPGPQVILRATLLAIGRQFPAGHRHKRPVVALNVFQIADDKTVIEVHASEPTKSVFRVFHQLDSYFGDLHASS